MEIEHVLTTSTCFYGKVCVISLPGETCKVLIIGMISDSRTGFHNQITCDMSHVSVGVCVRDEKCLCNNEKKMAMKRSYRFFHFYICCYWLNDWRVKNTLTSADSAEYARTLQSGMLWLRVFLACPPCSVGVYVQRYMCAGRVGGRQNWAHLSFIYIWREGDPDRDTCHHSARAAPLNTPIAIMVSSCSLKSVNRRQAGQSCGRQNCHIWCDWLAGHDWKAVVMCDFIPSAHPAIPWRELFPDSCI